MPLISSVHYSNSYCNAFWDGGEMVYGDGDGVMFQGFTRSSDFIGHEVMHGVTQYTANLSDVDEPGALNESISDVFGSMFRQWISNQDVSGADWLIGSDIMGPVALANGWVCVRNIADPSSKKSLTKLPSTFDQYTPHGDPHLNSGIPSRAFYLAALAVGGKSWERIGMIWYAALSDKSASRSMTFSEFALLTLAACKRLFPAKSDIADSIENAWQAVRVLP